MLLVVRDLVNEETGFVKQLVAQALNQESRLDSIIVAEVQSSVSRDDHEHNLRDHLDKDSLTVVHLEAPALLVGDLEQGLVKHHPLLDECAES